MSKILLLLAAVAALALAASAAPDFNDLDTSDLDASAVDDSDLDDIDADDLPEDSDETNAPDCPLNNFINVKTKECERCPAQQVVPYGESGYVGVASCFSCPFQIDIETKLCVTRYQSKVMNDQEADIVDQSPQTRQEKLATVRNPFRANWKICQSNSKSGERTMLWLEDVQRQSDDDEGCFTESNNRGTHNSFTLQPTNAGRNNNRGTNQNTQQQLQMSSCASGTTCCLPGFYGASSASCTECPSNKPSSPYSAPNINCQCPNSGSNKCFACTNKCKPYDSQSRTCLPVQCPSGQTCKTINNAAQCVSG